MRESWLQIGCRYSEPQKRLNRELQLVGTRLTARRCGRIVCRDFRPLRRGGRFGSGES